MPSEQSQIRFSIEIASNFLEALHMKLDMDKLAALAERGGEGGNDLLAFLRDSFGVGHASFVLISARNAVATPETYGFSTYAPDWIERYALKKYWLVDPAIVHGMKRVAAFQWADTELGVEQEKFFADATAYGISAQGFTIPVHGPHGDTTILSLSDLAEERSPEAWRELSAKAIKELLPIISVFHDRYIRGPEESAIGDPRLKLSSAERTALYWAGEGKTAAEIALILNKSVKTVTTQLTNARVRLGATNIAHAVSKMRGFLAPE